MSEESISSISYQSPSHNMHFENGVMELSHTSSMVTPSPSMETQDGEFFSPVPTQHDLLLEELKSHQHQKTLANQAINGFESVTPDSITDQEILLNLDKKENSPRESEQENNENNSHIHEKEEKEKQQDALQKMLLNIISFPAMNSAEAVVEHKKQPSKDLKPLKLNGIRDEEDSPLSPASYATGGFTSPTEKYKEIEVRTPLHESFNKAYSSFEPDKQELIRQEMGQTISIRNLLHRFQDPQQQLSSSTVDSHSKIHFQQPLLNTQTLNANQPKQPIVKTSHPVTLNRCSLHLLKTFPEPEIVLEEQKSVSELLSKFGVGQRVKTRKVVLPAKLGETPKVALRKAEEVSKKNLVYTNKGTKKAFEARLGQSNGNEYSPPPSYCTFWGGSGSVVKPNRLSEPPLGSLAAIQKSLHSVPNSPIKSLDPFVLSPEPQAELKYFFGHQSPKNVRNFYRVWGNKPSNQEQKVSSSFIKTSNSRNY